MLMSALTFDQIFEAAVGISSTLIVLASAWIVRVLIQIEKSKVVALSSVLEDDGTGNDDLKFEESTSPKGKQLEVETADAGDSAGDIELSPSGSSRKTEAGASSPTSSPKGKSGKVMTAKRARRKLKRISWAFINIQIVSVLVLNLLTYLLLVQSNAAVFLRVLGSFAVFAVFLRFQIGEELRRQRLDRLMLLLSLFLLIASMLSTLVYSFKTLKQGEIYEGPARIVGYSMEQYNNTKHDPTTRTDIAVSWGKDWGCPLSGGKVCQANIQGAMCQVHPDKENTKHKANYSNRHQRLLEDSDGSSESSNSTEAENTDEEDQQEDFDEEVEEALEEDLEDEEESNQDLEQENEDLQEQNEILQEEIEELKEENEVEDEENEELVDQENSELNEIADEYNEDLMIVEEEEFEDAESYVDAEYEQDEEKIQDEIDAASDDSVKDELAETLEEDKENQEEVDSEYEEDEELLDEYANEYAEASEEDYDEFVEEQEETSELDEEKDELKEEAEETEEFEEEYEESMYEDDDFYWDEYPTYYDDDLYEDEYWDYDWDSVWGDYACEDLFDSDISGQSYDPATPAGGDDEWPFVNIYGSCKTCEAYVLDYFAEEAFEETQEFKQQAIVYLAGAVAGFIWATLSYIQYRVMPTSENELQLLGSDGGVMA